MHVTSVGQKRTSGCLRIQWKTALGAAESCLDRPLFGYHKSSPTRHLPLRRPPIEWPDRHRDRLAPRDRHHRVGPLWVSWAANPGVAEGKPLHSPPSPRLP